MFNVQLGQEGGGSNVTAKSADAGGSAFQAVGNLAKDVGNIFNMHNQNQVAQAKSESEAQASASSQELSKQMGLIQEGVDQGSISQAKANQMGKLAYSALINEGADPVELKKTWDAAKGVYGGFEKTTEEKAIDQLNEQAVLTGRAFGGETPEQMREIRSQMGKQALYEEGLARADRDLERKDKQTASEAKANKHKYEENLYGVIESNVGKLDGVLNNISQRIKSGEITVQEGLDDMERQTSALGDQLTKQGMKSPEIVKTYEALNQKKLEAMKKRFTDPAGAEAAERELAGIIAQEQLSWMQTPKLRKFVALTPLLPPGIVTHISYINETMANMLSEADDADSEYPPNILKKDKDSKEEYANILRLNAEDKDIKNKPAQMDALVRQTNGMLKDIDASGTSVKNPAAFNEVMGLLSNPKFAESISLADPEAKEGALNVLEENYVSKVMPAIHEHLGKALNLPSPRSSANRSGGKSVNLKESVNVRVTAGGNVEFILDPSLPVSERKELQAKVRDLNKKLSPLVNQIVRAQSHIYGNTNYGKIAQEFIGDNFRSMLVQKEAEESPAGKTEAKAEAKPKVDDSIKAIPSVVSNTFKTKESPNTDAFNGEVSKFSTSGFKPSTSTISEVLSEQASILNKVNESNLKLDPKKGGKSIAKLKAEHGSKYVTPTSAVGKYQITGSTLKQAVKSLGLKGDEVFDEALQDRIMVDYLMRKKQPNLRKYFDSKSPTEDEKKKARVALGKEWEGFNSKHSTDEEAMKVLEGMREYYK